MASYVEMASAALFSRITPVRRVALVGNRECGCSGLRYSLVRSGLLGQGRSWFRSLATPNIRPLVCHCPYCVISLTRCGALPETDEGAEVEERAFIAATSVALLAPDATDEAPERAAAAVSEEAEIKPPAGPVNSKELLEIYESCWQWNWRGYKINYAVQGNGPPLLLVHGFGASIGHWRKNFRVLAESHRVYAIDLLGLGSSEKPAGFVYTMENWCSLLVDFLQHVVQSPAVLIGNSIGSLACLMATVEAPDLVRGTVMLNCAGGMNNKAVTDDWRLKLASPILWLADFVLRQPKLASRLFDSVKTRENITAVLQSVYGNKEAVDQELVELILRPANDPGALDAFVSIITGDPGPKPQTLMPRIAGPVLLIWGNQDPFTPIDGPVGKYFSHLSQSAPNVQLHLLPGVGHCPHDDRPELVHEKLLPWLTAI